MQEGWSIELDLESVNDAVNTPTAVLIEGLRRIKTVLDSWQIRWWLDHGTLLGVVRDGELPKKEAQNIGLFTDIERTTLIAHLAQWGFRFLSLLGYAEQSQNLNMKFHTAWFSFNFYRHDDPVYYYHAFKLSGCEPMRFEYPQELFETFEPIEFAGMQFWAPHPKEDFLAHAFGDNWQTPIGTEEWLKIANSVPAMKNSKTPYGRGRLEGYV